jgi:hypothetical protein
MFQFGVGGMYGNPNGGNQGSPSWPQRFGTIQNVDLEITQKLQSLYGQNKFPDDVAPSDMKISGKAAFANIEINIYNALFYAETTVTGISIVQPQESQPVPTSPGPYTIQVTNHATYSEDLGVQYASTGQPLVRVSSLTAAGQYTVSTSTGTYTFYSGDAGAAVLISYVYTSSSGTTLTANNHLQGYGPTFELFLLEPYQGTNGVHLYTCRCSKMSNPLKRDNYLISDFEFEAYPNAAGKVVDFFQISA